MKLDVAPGKYVVAVSGGVDSMALLDMLALQPSLELVVAHFDHGIRGDSAKDRELVEQAAGKYGLPFTYDTAQLGPQASEATARDARYAFLQKTRQEQGAQAIITAHHQDDVIETAMLMLLRGTGRLGLSALKSTNDIVRPLLNIPKRELEQYAGQHGVPWREDSTNQNDTYLRNYLRHTIVPKMTAGQRAQWLEIIGKAAALNREIDELLASFVRAEQVSKRGFIMLPHAVSTEVMAAWLRAHDASFNKYAIERLTVFAKTAAAGKLADIDKTHRLQIGKEYITLLANPSNRCV